MFKQFGGGGHGSGLSDNAELHQHQKLEKLYISTRAAKVFVFLLLKPFDCLKFCILLVWTHAFFIFFQHYQRDIVRGVEGYIVTGSKQVEIGDLLNLDH